MVRVTTVKEVSEDRISLIRETEKEKRVLVYYRARCIGCGICEEVCPLDAIKVGAIGTIVRKKLEEPFILIDEKRCALCGICRALCFKQAFELFIDGVELENLEGYVRSSPQIVIDKERCIPFDKSKVREHESEGVCTECEDVCPTKAIDVVRIEEEKYEVRLDESLCCYCGKCVKKCPIEGVIKVRKPFEGEISIDFDKCEKCDACVEVCPAKAIEVVVPSEPYVRAERYRIADEYCMFCESCIQMCPVDAIKIRRRQINLTGTPSGAWRASWERVIESLKG